MRDVRDGQESPQGDACLAHTRRPNMGCRSYTSSNHAVVLSPVTFVFTVQYLSGERFERDGFKPVQDSIYVMSS